MNITYTVIYFRGILKKIKRDENVELYFIGVKQILDTDVSNSVVDITTEHFRKDSVNLCLKTIKYNDKLFGPKKGCLSIYSY